MKTPKRIRYLWVMLLVAALFPKYAGAQTPRDVPTIEAYIYDHKQQRSLLLARSALETANAILHESSRTQSKEYREVNDELDKYTRAFDIIDLVYSTVSTGFNVYRTYDNVSDKIGKYGDMISDYHEKILKRGRIEAADTLLLTVNLNAISSLADECKNLYASVATLALYASGKVCCTTAAMMVMIDSINKSLDKIKEIVNAAYYQTWKFIQARTSYWKSELYREKSRLEIANDALGRWRQSGQSVISSNN